MTETEYKDLLIKQKQGKLILYIDTAWFRKFFTKADGIKLSAKTGFPHSNEILILKLIVRLIEPVTLVFALAISAIIFSYWSLVAIPLIIVGWGLTKAMASTGAQSIKRLILASLFSFVIILLGIFANVLFFATVISLLYFITNFLYFYTAFITFNALNKSFSFYTMFEDLNPKPIWIETISEAERYIKNG